MFQLITSLFSSAAPSTAADPSSANGGLPDRILPVTASCLEDHPQVKKAIVDTMRSALEQSQLHNEWFKGSSDARDMYMFTQLGTAFDQDVKGGTLACDIFVKQPIDGQIHGLMAFEKPGEKYDNGEARARYDPKIESSLGSIPGRLDWVNNTLIPAATELKNKLHYKPTEETHLSWLAAHPESKDPGSMERLLTGLGEDPRFGGTPVYVFCTSDKETELYTGKGYKIVDTKYLPAPSIGDENTSHTSAAGGECQLSILEYVPDRSESA